MVAGKLADKLALLATTVINLDRPNGGVSMNDIIVPAMLPLLWLSRFVDEYRRLSKPVGRPAGWLARRLLAR